MKKRNLILTALITAGFLASFHVHAQEEDAAGPDNEAAAAGPSAEQPGATPVAEPKIDPATIKFDPNKIWVSFIVNDGRVQSNRDYFGALKKSDFDALVQGQTDGMLRVEQVFYYNSATRQFSRFDATSGNAIPILEKHGYFRPDSIMRIVPLNQGFVRNLAAQGFLSVGP